jgi:hypothetical protein
MSTTRSFINLVSNYIILFLYSIGFLLASIIRIRFFLTLYGISCFSTVCSKITIYIALLSISALIF